MNAKRHLFNVSQCPECGKLMSDIPAIDLIRGKDNLLRCSLPCAEKEDEVY